MYYAISDLHGYSKEGFLKLLSSAGFSDGDFLFVLGDVIDRGDESIGLLQWIMNSPNVQMLIGNHEAMLLACDFLFSKIDKNFIDGLTLDKLELFQKWKDNGGGQTVSQMLKLLPEERTEIVEFLRDCPYYAGVTVGDKDFVLTHAGLGGYSPEKKIKDYSFEELIWNRPYLEDGYSNEFITVFGHTPTAYYGREFKGKVIMTDTWINIDTGASGGLSPTLLRLDDLMTFSFDENGEIISCLAYKNV